MTKANRLTSAYRALLFLIVTLLMASCTSKTLEIEETGKCLGCNLSTVNFSELQNTEGLELQGSSLKGNLISDINFIDVDFSDALFEGVTLRNVVFSGGSFTNSRFSNVNFDNVSFESNADLSGVFIDASGEKLILKNVATRDLELRSSLVSLELSGFSDDPKRISGTVSDLAFDSTIHVYRFSAQLVQNYINTKAYDLDEVLSEVGVKANDVQQRVSIVNRRMSHLDSKTGEPNYNPYVPDSIANKLKNSPFRRSDRKVEDTIYDDLSDAGKNWYQAYKADGTQHIHDNMYVPALIRSGVSRCREPEVPDVPLSIGNNNFEWLKIINLHENFSDLLNEVTTYEACMSEEKVALYEAELANLSAGLDEINELGQQYFDRQAAQRQIYDAKITKYVADFYKNEDLGNDFMQTVAMVELGRLSQSEQARMLVSPTGIQDFMNSLKADLATKIVNCPARYFRNSIVDGRTVLSPTSKEAELNLEILDMLVRVKNDDYEPTEADIQKLSGYGFTEAEVAQRIEIATNRFSECFVDVVTNYQFR